MSGAAAAVVAVALAAGPVLGTPILGDRSALVSELSALGLPFEGGTSHRGILPTESVRPSLTTLDAAPSPSTGSPSPVASPTPSPSIVRRTPSPTPSRSAAAPAPAGVRAGAETLTDLAYASASGTQRLDLYLPERTGKAVPLVVLIHGGGFSDGHKGDLGGQAEALRGKGYAVAAVDYRLSGEARFPAGVQDVKAAVRWLRAHAGQHGLHPRRFAAWGHSAGGYLATMLGVTSGRATAFDDPALGNPRVSSAVQAVITLSGPTDLLGMDADTADPGGCSAGAQTHDDPSSPESRWLGAPIQTVPELGRSANLLRFLAKPAALPPFVVVHGSADCLVPHGQSDRLVAALTKRGAKVKYTLLDGMGHDLPGGTGGLYEPALAKLDALFGRV